VLIYPYKMVLEMAHETCLQAIVPASTIVPFILQGDIPVKRLGILVFLMVVVLAGGAISSGLLNDPLNGLLIKQTSDPNASVFDATPQQALQLVLWIGFVLFNLIGAGVTLLFFFWLMNRALSGLRRGQPPAASTGSEITTTE
jgi:hypothetical protein